MFATKRCSQTFGEKGSCKQFIFSTKNASIIRRNLVYVGALPAFTLGEIIFNEYRYATLLAAAKSDGLNSKCPTNERVLP